MASRTTRAWDWLVRGPGSGQETRGADPTLPWGSSYIPTNGQTGLVAAGFNVNDDTALSITSVYTAVSILADSVATLPLHTFRRGARAMGPVNDPMIVSNPWPEVTVNDFMSQLMVSLTLRGNFFGQIVDRDRDGYATCIMPVHPDSVMARRMQDGTRAYWISGQRVKTEDMVHIPNLLVPGAFVGLNPVEYMRQSWGLAGAAERYMGQFYANSATPTGVIEIGEDLTEEETLELARSWRMTHGGLQGGGLPAVLTGGATWRSIQVSPGDAQFLQTRAFQREEIASFFRIPPHLMGQQDRTSSYGTGVEQMELNFVINTLRAYLTKIEAYWTRLLPGNLEARFDLTSRLRGDQGQRYTAYAMAVNNGWLSTDEIRAREDLPPLPDGQGAYFWRPLNFAPVDKIVSGEAGVTGGPGGGMDQEPTAPAPGVGNIPDPDESVNS